MWPRETDIYSLLPKSDGKFRALYTGVIDIRVIGQYALPMASLFDEYLIESPIVNPNNIRSEFSPTKSPSNYKYQALKDFLLMLELEPYIGYGLINLIPDPSNFDLNLMRAMMDMATYRPKIVESERDIPVLKRLAIEDYLNVIHTMSRDVKIRSLVSEFGMSDDEAAQLVDMSEANADVSPLTTLQPMPPDNGGQFMQYSMIPNYEMALFIAQVTGSVIITDSESRWAELQPAQHRQLGVVLYPWNDVYGQMSRIPMDYPMVESYTKTHHQIDVARTTLKMADEMVLTNNRAINELKRVAESVARLNGQLEKLDGDGAARLVNSDCRILAPDGGIYDRNVQRLLALSGCLRYDQKVRSIYYIGSKLPH